MEGKDAQNEKYQPEGKTEVEKTVEKDKETENSGDTKTDAKEESTNKPTQNGDATNKPCEDINNSVEESNKKVENVDTTNKPTPDLNNSEEEPNEKVAKANVNVEKEDKDVEKEIGNGEKEIEKGEKEIEKGEKEIEKGEKVTRGVKRKANVIEKDEPKDTLVNEETVEQKEKENVNSKNNDNVLEENQSKDDSSVRVSERDDTMGKGKRARIPNKRYSDILLTPNNRKSLGQSKLPSDSSDPEPIVVVKEEPVDTTGSRVESPTLPFKKNRVPGVRENLQEPKFLKPFKFGWKRELVWRSTSTTSKPVGDIYYYTPTGKKVRSFRELADYLQSVPSKNLTVENFSFTKEPIGLDNPEKEIIRDAKIKSSENAIESPVVKPVESIKKSKRVLSPKATPKFITESTKAEDTPTKNKVELTSAKSTPISASKKTKMPAKKGRGPAPKRARLSTTKNEEPAKVESTPVRPSPTKTRANQSPASKLKKRNLKLRSITNSNTGSEDKGETKFMENYLQNLSFGYNTLLYVFQYLKVQDLLRAGCVCTMWRDIASHPILWRTVRMKNSQVHSFDGLANTLKKHGTTHLDLRKMLLPSSGDEIWPEFSKAIAKVDTLRKIELCRCPASVVENLALSNPHLEVINAVTIKCESMNLGPLKSLTCIKELRLKSTSGLNITSIDSLKELKSLRHLSLTSVNDLHKLNLNVIAELKNLESLDLGECTDFPKNFGVDILSRLDKLEKLRLEKGQGNCHVFEILEAAKGMKKLEQLELVNFDVKSGFDKALGACTNIKKLMIIPTYISQSATTNNMVLSGVLRLQGSLTHFVWGVTLELLRVTELFVDQCEEPKDKKDKKPAGNGDSIPVLKPVPDLSHGDIIQAASNPPQVEILPLPNLQKLLLNSLPTTRVKILKIPFHATWRQTLTDSV